MEFRDLKKQYQALKTDIDQAMVDVATSGAYIMGSPVKELEKELAEYVGVKHCLSCANGTDALTLALKALGIGKGDAVFVPDFTFFSSAEVVSLEGATPVFVDVDPRTFNMDPRSLDDAIRSVLDHMDLRPKAVIAVDLFGLPANFTDIRAIAKREGMYVIEDGAQGFGGSIRMPKASGDGFEARRACSFGDISTTSFFPAKPLGCYGDGGAVFTDNDEWAALIESYRVHGKGSFKYDNVRIGLNSRLDTLQAAILRIKFRAFKEHELADVNKMAEYYTQLFDGMTKFLKKEIQITTPYIPDGYTSSWAQYTIQLSVPSGNGTFNREALQAKLKAKGIPSMVYYPTPMSQQTAFKEVHSYALTPNAQNLAKCVLSLPMHPYITREEVRQVVETLISSL
ncbi:MAG: DegT/DnrJ/EryC1/StrS family aminotransferase [Bacteroidales bacterium]|nr:DegT/DnrJ/EryC1/StrS family aminotransferase [Bacteroidales bacterium]